MSERHHAAGSYAKVSSETPPAHTPPTAAEQAAQPPTSLPDAKPGRSRILAFAVLCVLCLALAIGSITWAAMRARAATTSSQLVTVASNASAPVVAPTDQPFVLFQHVARDQHYAKIAFAPIGTPNESRTVTGLTCERVYFAAGQGLCLLTEGGLINQYFAYTFGPDFRPRHKIAMAGLPSRTRISSDGRYGTATVFVHGHSYADGNLSTQTILIDMATGATLGELEQFTVERDGADIKAVDFNFWGVTFAHDSNRYYATLATGGQTYLVEGDVAARTMRVRRENVECPSLSPDNKRIAFKKRMPGRNVTWRVHVLDLETMQETPVNEARSVDDQVEWLDDQTILYAVDADVWSVPADGSGAPTKFVAQALSPAIVR